RNQHSVMNDCRLQGATTLPQHIEHQCVPVSPAQVPASIRQTHPWSVSLMKKILSIFGIAGSFLAMAANVSAAPINDDFANAIPITGPIVTVTGSNVGATKNFFSGEPFVAGNFGGANVWWTWTATASGQTTIDTEG